MRRRGDRTIESAWAAEVTPRSWAGAAVGACLAQLLLQACGGSAAPAGSHTATAVHESPPPTEGAEGPGAGQSPPAPSPPAPSPPAPSAPAQSAPAENAQRLEEGAENRIALQSSDPSQRGRGDEESRIEASATEAAVRFFVVDKDKGPIDGIIVCMQALSGRKYYTRPSDSVGFAEVLVPNGQEYELVFLSLGRRKIGAKLPISDEPNQNIKLTLRYKRHEAPPPTTRSIKLKPSPRFVLEGIEFDTGKATLRKASLPRLESVLEFMRLKKRARVEIAGHTDNVGNPRANKKLSERRAKAVRKYLVSKGIEASRLTAVGYGDEFPIADNDTEPGRQMNRRIEAMEL